MTLDLVNPDVDLTLELYIDPAMEEAICIQWERIKDRSVRQTFTRKLENQLECLVAECMDWDLKKPITEQVSYAELISKRLGISVPSDAVRNRFHMALFIDTYSEQHRAETPKLDTPRSDDIEKARLLAAEKLKYSASTNGGS